jgi:ATP-dependent helicase/DNAse subunit B
MDQKITIPRELEEFLSRLGLSEEMVTNLKTKLENVDIEEQLNTAREYLRDSTEKAKTYTKENPAKVAAGVAVLAIGAGLLINALNREKKIE